MTVAVVGVSETDTPLIAVHAMVVNVASLVLAELPEATAEVI
jgi:hypothetical protein